MMTTKEVAARFNELAQQEKWFEIQDELFADNVKSIEPAHSKALRQCRKVKMLFAGKVKAWVKRVEAFHGGSTTEPACCW
jgi:hypothetical protein